MLPWPFPYGSTGCSAGSTEACNTATPIPTRRCAYGICPSHWLHHGNLLSWVNNSDIAEFSKLKPPPAEQKEEHWGKKEMMTTSKRKQVCSKLCFVPA